MVSAHEGRVRQNKIAHPVVTKKQREGGLRDKAYLSRAHPGGDFFLQQGSTSWFPPSNSTPNCKAIRGLIYDTLICLMLVVAS